MYNNFWDCKTCYWWYGDGTCDMCAYGHPYTIDNNGLKPEEVKDCNAYVCKHTPEICRKIKAENEDKKHSSN